MTTEEIIRAIRVIRHSSKRERNAGRLPSINGLSQLTGLSRFSIYRYASGESRPDERARHSIKEALQHSPVTGMGGKQPMSATPSRPAD